MTNRVGRVPNDLRSRIVDVFGDAGRAWLEELPDRIQRSASAWGIMLNCPFPNLTYNYVAVATLSDGTPTVLKAGVPNPEMRGEIEALRLWAGHGAVQLLAASPDEGVMLLKRLHPGTTLLSQFDRMDDDAATSIAADVMQQLWYRLPESHPFQTIADLARGFDRLRERFDSRTGPFPARFVEQAEVICADLNTGVTSPLLLHGDLHHDNILHDADFGWMAIDPKGIAGDPAWEVGAFVCNPILDLLAGPNPKRTLSRRLDIFTERLGIDREQLRDSAFAGSMLSAWWSYEDHGVGHEYSVHCAELLRDA